MFLCKLSTRIRKLSLVTSPQNFADISIPPNKILVFCVNHFKFYLYCWPFTASQGVTINSSSKTVSNFTCVVSILVQAQHKNQKSELSGQLSLVTCPADSPLKFWRHFNTIKIFVLCKNYFKFGFMYVWLIL